LKIIGFVRPPQCKREDVINIPGFAGIDLLRAACANASPFEE